MPVDTGAEVTIVRTRLFEKMSVENKLELKNVTLAVAVAECRPSAFSGCGRFHLEVGSFPLEHGMWVADIDVNALLTYDFLQICNCIIDNGRGQMTVGGMQKNDITKGIDEWRVIIVETVLIPPES